MNMRILPLARVFLSLLAAGELTSAHAAPRPGEFRFTEIFCSRTENADSYELHVGEFARFQPKDPDYSPPPPMDTLLEYRDRRGNPHSVPVRAEVRGERNKAEIFSVESKLLLDVYGCRPFAEPAAPRDFRLRCEGTFQASAGIDAEKDGHYFCDVNR